MIEKGNESLKRSIKVNISGWTAPELYAACAHGSPETRQAAYLALWEYLLRAVTCIVYDQPNAQEVAQDCAQEALFRIHQRLDDCHQPEAFLAWARRIAAHLAIDELRRTRRLLPLDDPGDEPEPVTQYPSPEESPEAQAQQSTQLAGLRRLLQAAPVSKRSQRAVAGRYLDDLPDEDLARQESQLSGQTVLPSHIQVTRTKDIARLRDYRPLQIFLSGETDGGKNSGPDSVS